MPTYEPFSRQYRSAIFVASREERAIAEASLLARQSELGKRVWTAIEPAGTFWSAEDYHQKYSLRGEAEVMAAVAARYPEGDWVDSTAAARLNAILGGHHWDGDLETLGLDGAALKRVRKLNDGAR